MIDARHLLKRSDKNFPRLDGGIDFTGVSSDEKKEIRRRIRKSYYRQYYQDNKAKARKYARENRVRRRGPQPKAATKFPMKRPARDTVFSYLKLQQLPTEKFGSIVNYILDPSNECVFAGLR